CSAITAVLAFPTRRSADLVTAAEALIQRGYGLEQTPGNAIYLQQNYLKFGKTDYQVGLTLPSIEGVPENATVQLSFDWAPMVGRSEEHTSELQSRFDLVGR